MNRDYLNYLGLIVAVLIGFSVLAGCTSRNGTGEPNKSTVTTAQGQLQPAQMTSFMYGTHLLMDESGDRQYALTSENVNLSEYEGERVRVRGKLKEGYPVDGGPPYLVVTSISTK